MLFSAAVAAPLPLELIGLEPTPRTDQTCEVLVADHDAETPFGIRVLLSTPDASGKSWVQRVTVGLSHGEAGSPLSTVHELDVRRSFFDDRFPSGDSVVRVSVKPSFVDWSRWPFAMTFIGPRMDDPTQLGVYRIESRGDDKTGWGSCMLALTGPAGIGGCTMVGDLAGTCLADYAARHRLGPDR